LGSKCRTFSRGAARVAGYLVVPLASSLISLGAAASQSSAAAEVTRRRKLGRVEMPPRRSLARTRVALAGIVSQWGIGIAAMWWVDAPTVQWTRFRRRR